MTALVITTINGLTDAIAAFIGLNKFDDIYIIGDKGSKTLERDDPRVHFVSYEQQLDLSQYASSSMPARHYSRKNLGYLLAMHKGATEIYETDDDNFPYDGKNLESYKLASPLCIDAGNNTSFNCYSLFTSNKIWPRGFPLNEVNCELTYSVAEVAESAAVVQGLADKDPDVDAIYRLTQAGGEFIFNDEQQAFGLPSKVYCPFNSQNTLWQPSAYVLMYLPVTVSFRFTDILRSFVAKRCLDHAGLRLAFAPATVFQERNEHDLFKDFTDELECYTNTPKVLAALEALKLDDTISLADALLACYQTLVDSELVSEAELTHVGNWIKDVQANSQ